MHTQDQSALGFSFRPVALRVLALAALLAAPVLLRAQTTFTYTNAQTDATSYVLSGANLFTVPTGSATQSGVLSGSGSFATDVSSLGTLTLTGANSYAGGTTISSGTVVAGGTTSLGAAGGTVAITGGVLSVGFQTLNYLFSGTGGTILVTGDSNLGSFTDPAGFNFLGTVNLGANALTLLSPGTVTVGAVIMATNGQLNTNHGFVLQHGGSLTANGSATVNGTFVNSGLDGLGAVDKATVQGPTAGGTTLTFSGPFSGTGDQNGNIRLINTNNPSNGAGGQTRVFGNTSLAATTITTMNIGGSTAGQQYDQYLIQGGGTLTLAGTLILNLDGVVVNSGVSSLTGSKFAPAGGDSFTLFSKGSGTLTGSFTTVDTSQASLSSNLLAWDTSKIATTGALNVVFTNNYFTGTFSGTWGSGSSTTTLSNFTSTNSAGSASISSGLASYSNVFLSMPGATNSASQTLGTNFTINSLSFMGTAVTLVGGTPTAKTLTLSAANSFQDQNGTNYAAGTGLVVQAGAAASTINSGTGGIHIILARSQTWEIDNAAANPLTVAVDIKDTGTNFSLTKTGVGTLVLTSSTNSWKGGTEVAAGTLKTSGTGIFGSTTQSGALTVSGGTLDMAGTATTLSVSGVSLSSGTIMNSAGTTSLTVSSTGGIVVSGGGTSTLSAKLTGPAALTKSGGGTLKVLAAQLYTGITSLTAGNTEFSSAGAFASAGSVVNVNTAGTLSGTGNILGAVTVGGGGTVSPGVGSGAGALTLGSATFSSGGALALNLTSDGTGTAGTGFSQLAVTGNLDLSGLTASSFTLKLNPVSGALLDAPGLYTWASVITTGGLVGSFAAGNFIFDSSAFGPASGTFALVQNGGNANNFDLTYLSAVPEPATVALLTGLSALGLAALRRRRLAGKK